MATNRTTTVAVEAIHSGDGSTARITTVAVEALHTGDGSTARTTTLAVEVLRSVSEASVSYGSGQPVIIITQ